MPALDLAFVFDILRDLVALVVQAFDHHVEPAPISMRDEETQEIVAHRVLRPITEALWDTTPEALAPRLEQLRDGFPGRLARAKEEANDRLDQERNKRVERPVVKVDLHLRGRELESPEQIEALLRELEERLLPLLKTKQRVRIVG